jgi:predicted dehydrogenase
MRRRSFLKATAIGGVATAVGPNLLFGQATKPSERIGVALIGASNMGGKTHLPTLIGEDRIQLRAICDVDSEVVKDRLAKAKEGYAAKTGQAGYKGIDGLGDFRELLTRDDIDAVVIATPDQWHVPMAKAFVKAGKAVYLEKPLSLFVPEGRELVDLVEKHEAVVQVGTQRRSQDQTIIACELVRNGVIGKIKHVDVVTGTRSNMGAHHFDVAQWGLGVDRSGPVKVSGTGKRNPEGSIHDVFFECDVDFEYANGATLRFKSADEHWNKDGVTFHGENGTINAMRKLTSEPAELVRTSRDDFKVKFRKTPGSHMPNWVQCILDNKPENLHAPVEVGHRSVTACHLVNLAMLTGRELEWDPEMERFKNDDEANKLLTRKPREGWVF